MARTVPQVVVWVTAGQLGANHQGAYSALVTYQPGMWVTNAEQLWVCIQRSTNHSPETGSEYWTLIGSIT